MASITLSGDTSGSVALTVPSVAGTNTATVPAQTGTLEMLGSGTSVSASGTAVDFTSIPSWVKRITVMFSGVSTSGTSVPLIQLGDSDGIENTGYSGTSSNITTAVTTASYTTGFGIGSANASTQLKGGSIILTLIDSASNLWAASGVIGRGDADGTAVTGGYKALSSVLTQIRITTVNGTDTFDAGSINIIYEG